MSWQVDLTAPTLNLTVKPAAMTRSSTERIEFMGRDNGAPVLSYQCRLNDGNFMPCSSPVLLSNLKEGTQNFALQAIDSAKNKSEVVSAQWVIDLTAPTQPVLNSSVSDRTNTNMINITFVSNDGSGSGIARYECSDNGAASTPCSSPFIKSSLEPGTYSFSVRAIDAVGNIGANAVKTWSVLPSPDPIIIPKPPVTETENQPIQFSIAFDDPMNTFGADRSGIESNLKAAMADWSQYLTGKTTIRILIRASPNLPRFGGASRTTVFKSTQGGFNIFEDITIYKLRTGLDPNPTLPDIYLDVNIEFMRTNYFIDPNPLSRTTPVPRGKVDLVTVLAHELGHAFGMNGFLNRSNGAYPPQKGISVYDALILAPTTNTPLFNGALTVSSYGSQPPITYFSALSTPASFIFEGVTYLANLGSSQNFYHYGRYNSATESQKTLRGLMGGAWLFPNTEGVRIRVSEFDAALMRDLGIPARRTF